MRVDTQEELVTALAVLDDRDRTVLRGLYVEPRLSFRQLARKMGVSPRSVQRYRAAAVRKLNEALGNEVDALLAPERTETETERTAPGRPTPMFVPWATCRQCLGQRVEINEDDLCARCSPVMAATKVAAMGGVARQRGGG